MNEMYSHNFRRNRLDQWERATREMHSRAVIILMEQMLRLNMYNSLAHEQERSRLDQMLQNSLDTINRERKQIPNPYL